jgi:hypothetical protein
MGFRLSRQGEQQGKIKNNKHTSIYKTIERKRYEDIG